MSRSRYMYYGALGIVCTLLQWATAVLYLLLFMGTIAAATTGWELGILKVVLVKLLEVTGICLSWLVITRMFHFFGAMRGRSRVSRGLKPEWARSGRFITERGPNMIAYWVIGLAITGFAVFSTFMTVRSYFVSNSWGYFTATSDPQCSPGATAVQDCTSLGNFVSDDGRYHLKATSLDMHKVLYGEQLRMNYDPTQHDRVHPLTTSGPSWWPLLLTLPVALLGVPGMIAFTYRAVRNFWIRTASSRG